MSEISIPEKLATQRSLFKEASPPCGARLTFSPTLADDTKNSKFTFDAEAVEMAAMKAFITNPNAIGLKQIAYWASLRDASITNPTPLPEGVDCLELILADLISAGNGQVRCYECDKDYSVTEVKLTYKIAGSWGYKHYLCPCSHSLAMIREMHLMQRRKYE